MTIFKKRAFTLIEILVAAGVSAVFLGMAITLFLRFTGNFSSSEGSAVLMQDCALFTARLRNDLNNAVKAHEHDFVTVDDKQLMFHIYDSSDGNIKPVVYSVLPQKDGYYSVIRRLANASEHTVIKGKLASYTWRLNEELIPTGATPVKRIGLFIDLKMGSSDLKNKSFNFKTVIYPVRANHMYATD